jgi:hypothetical protein
MRPDVEVPLVWIPIHPLAAAPCTIRVDLFGEKWPTLTVHYPSNRSVCTSSVSGNPGDPVPCDEACEEYPVPPFPCEGEIRNRHRAIKLAKELAADLTQPDILGNPDVNFRMLLPLGFFSKEEAVKF